MKHPVIILVEDDAAQREEAVLALQLAGLMTLGAPDAKALNQLMALYPVDVVVLDVGLPGESGLVIAKRLAQQTPPVGIIMLTARSMLADKLQGMSAGSDVYLVKPADPRELIANITALRRRMAAEPQSRAIPVPEQHAKWVLFDKQSRLSYGGGGTACIELSQLQCRLLLAFKGLETGQTISRESIMHTLGHSKNAADPHRLETLLSRLRQKVRRQIGQDLPLKAVPGLGYALTESIDLALI